MKGIAHRFFLSGIADLLAGMVGGMLLGASRAFERAPVHTSLDLMGWVSMALCDLYYKATPAAARAHFVLATAGVWLLSLGLVLAVGAGVEVLATAGAVLSLAVMLVPLGIVSAHRG